MIHEDHFVKYGKHVVGSDKCIETPFGTKKLLYADWVASGRLYHPIEDAIVNKVGPLVANTHSESSYTGETISGVYKSSRRIIKKHVNATDDDIIITSGSGMTEVVNKLQRILGLRIPEQALKYISIKPEERPVVFVTHMEHHSNHTSWLETIADVVVIKPNKDLLVDVNSLKLELKKYENRKVKIGSFSACSNVTGIEVPYHELSKIMHQHGGLCFVDFAASAPYVEIDMHPCDSEMYLDALFFSPHKFIGGPGSCGVLIFNKSIYNNVAPDTSGGGTVNWTNRWGKYHYVEDIETKEDAGTPGFLQSIKAAMAIRLKEEMNVVKMAERESEMVSLVLNELRKVENITILANNVEERLGIISFYIEDAHFNLVVRLLSDYYGIQVRGGCSCAGTYGHYLLHVDSQTSHKITSKIDRGDFSEKPGWVRISLHPVMSEQDINLIIEAVRYVAANWKALQESYEYIPEKNEYEYKFEQLLISKEYESWFSVI
ncbi:aminotransferase class V-fold PLP-dependent enzyme [Saccharicrinis aurantiacus]|uniref:aminotransferase class V-fold PLP-dependent enzyme n=1 Tax=Saccharicrinis aurantiacus TaxID=1849719 RepID=UPI00094FB5C6|nr:aminotransferase class V-fold PLP-dependent enzyme [Saccharicrinis aurantiacus]